MDKNQAMQKADSRIRILSMVEATNINAVAKNVLEFHRSALELHRTAPDFPVVEGIVVTFDRTLAEAETPNEFLDAARQLGLEVEVIRERRRFDPRIIPALRQVIATRSPDIVVTHSVKSHFLLGRSRVWQQFPWVGYHHGYTSTDWKMWAFNRLDRYSLPLADRIITVCRAFARELAATTSVPMDSIAVQHNSIRLEREPDAEEVRLLRDRLGISIDEKIVLSVGRLSREKGHHDLLDAFQHVRTSEATAGRLVIVGDGPERQNLQAVAATFGYQDEIVFAGQVANVRPFYAAADVLVLPSHSEGSSNVLLEAMAARVPIVATAVGGVIEMVEDEVSALVVPSRKPDTMAAAIERLLSDKQLALRLTDNAARLTTDRYSPEKYARSMVDIFRAVIDHRAGKITPRTG